MKPFKGLPKKLLMHFRQNAGKVLSRDELAREVWGLKMEPRSRCIDQTIATIRKALVSGEKIETVQSHGYRFSTGHDLHGNSRTRLAA